MLRRTLRSGDDPTHFPGAVLCRDLHVPGARPAVTIRRGTPLAEAIQRFPPNGEHPPIEIVVPTRDEIGQADASLRLARAISGAGTKQGAGIEIEGPHQGQVNLKAADAGILRVDAGAVARFNRTGLTLVASALDGRVVQAGETVAIVKAPGLFVPEGRVARAGARLGESHPIRVATFRHTRVGLIAGTRVRAANLNVSARLMRENLSRFGADISAVRHLDQEDPRQIAEVYRQFIDSGVEVVLVAGSIMLDPTDPFIVGARRVGARLICRGAPIDPGTMFWLAYVGPVPIFGLASCEMYGRTSILDLLMPYALAGERLTKRLIAELGYGGLLNETQQARRPPAWGQGPGQGHERATTNGSARRGQAVEARGGSASRDST